MIPPPHAPTHLPPARAQARQGLGIGNPAFEPTSLERYSSSLDSAAPTADWLRKYGALLENFRADAHGARALSGANVCTRVGVRAPAQLP